MQWPLLPRVPGALDVPLVVHAPEDAPTLAGCGEVTLAAQCQGWPSVPERTRGALGLAQRLPTGSRAWGFGRDPPLAPSLTAGMALGPCDLLGAVTSAWGRHGAERPREHDGTARLALGYPVSWWVRPLLAVVTVTQIRGPATHAGETARLHTTQGSLVPGCKSRPQPGMPVRGGVAVPVTTATALDDRCLSALVVAC